MARTYDWNAPAKLFHWPADNGSDEEVLYPTLVHAIRAAAEGDAETAWIVTEGGEILNPKLIEDIRLDLAPGRRARPLSLFGWARAA